MPPSGPLACCTPQLDPYFDFTTHTMSPSENNSQKNFHLCRMGISTRTTTQVTMPAAFTAHGTPPLPPPAYIPVQNLSAYSTHQTPPSLLPTTSYQSSPIFDGNGGYWVYIPPGRKRRRELKRSERLCCGGFWLMILVVIVWGIYWGSTREARECKSNLLT